MQMMRMMKNGGWIDQMRFFLNKTIYMGGYEKTNKKRRSTNAKASSPSYHHYVFFFYKRYLAAAAAAIAVAGAEALAIAYFYV